MNNILTSKPTPTHTKQKGGQIRNHNKTVIKMQEKSKTNNC